MGRRYVNTTEAGQTSIGEQWYSPDLKFQLIYTIQDPATGNVDDKIIDIHRGDPDPSVFQLPEGFTVKQVYPKGQLAVLAVLALVPAGCCFSCAAVRASM
jgi:hypothetical protein